MKAGLEARRFHVKVTRPSGSTVERHFAPCLVTIFDGDTEIGSYERNYGPFAEQTFEPFELNGRWFALYARDYTSTRVMSLPDCRDLGGEDPNPYGFCPVEFFVPRYKEVTGIIRDTGEQRHFHYFEQEAEGKSGHVEGAYSMDFVYGPWLSLPTGFVAGCLWGEDTSWKLEVIDLSRAAHGVIVRTARFGHLQIAGKMPLAQAIRLDSHFPHWQFRATIYRQERRDVATGALIDPDDE